MVKDISGTLLVRRLLGGAASPQKQPSHQASSNPKGTLGRLWLKETQTVELSNSSYSSTTLISEEDCVVVTASLPQEKPKLFLPCQGEGLDGATTKIDPAAQLRQKQIDFWTRCVLNRTVSLGSRHIRTAEALMELGNAQLSDQDYCSATRTFVSALKVFRKVHGDKHLTIARALDKAGLSESMRQENYDFALRALMEAWAIRCEVLGPDHIDSVDSLNNIAGVYLNRGEFTIAARHYKVVMSFRQQIFGGIHHASVAVTAYTLACILDDQLNQSGEAHVYFNLAKHIYESLGMVTSQYYTDTCSRLEKHSSLLDL